MPAMKSARQYTVPVQTLRDRLEWCRKDESKHNVALLDIGEFPESSPSTSKSPPELGCDEKFHFLKWLHRSNGSDLAIVDHVKHGRRVLKMHKDKAGFKSEKAAYSHFKHFDVQSCVIACYGWTRVTPKSFAEEKKPTCVGPETDHMKDQRKYGHYPHLPTPLPSGGASASYDWNNPHDWELAEIGIDFRPPSVEESWNWVLDTSQFGKDGQWMANGEDITHSRNALLLEYLPNSRRFQSHLLTDGIALKALDGFQQIQKALVDSRDHDEMISRNVLLAEDGRVVFIDFDRAKVFDRVDPDTLHWFKKHLIEFYRIVFRGMLAAKEEGKASRFD